MKPGSFIRQTSATEIHYSVQQVAVLWGLDPKTIREAFEDEPDVIKKRKEDGSRATLRIPHSALIRVHARLVDVA